MPPEKTNKAGSRPSVFYRFGLLLAHHRWFVIICWVILLGGGILLIPRFQKSLTGFPLDVNGSDSQQVQTLLQQRFAHAFSEQDLLVFHSDTLTIQDAAYQQVVAQAVQTIAKEPGVVAVISPLDQEAQGQVSSDQHAALALVGLRGDDNALQALVPKLAQAAQSAATSQVQVYLTGNTGVNLALATQEEADLEQSERLGLPIALLVLVVAFGSLVAAGLPLLLALVGVVVAFGVLGILTLFTSFGLFIEIIAPMIGLGVGIDYSLFLITRYREELGRRSSRDEAVAQTLATTGKMIFCSGVIVLISLASMYLVNMKIFADIASGAMVTVAVMLAVALTLLPAILTLLGRRVNRLSLPFLRQTIEHTGPEHGFWARWAQGIMRRPLLWALFSFALLVLLAAPLFQIRLGINLGAGAISNEPVGKGLTILQQQFSQGAISPIQIGVESKHGPLNDADLNIVAQLTTALKADPAVASVASVTDLLDQVAGNHSAAALAAVASQPQGAAELGYLVNLSRGGDVTIVTVIPRAASDSNEAVQLVRHIRSTIIPQTQEQAQVNMYVGGFSAQIVDMSDESLRKLPLVLGLVLGLSFLFLTLIFRSLFLPLKAILMNLLSVGAAYGLLVLVFQNGLGERLFHFTSPGYLQVYLPLFTFALLFGLSMDYEVFLIGRMKEEWERVGSNEQAVARGLQHTARAITSAAAIMVAVFASFAFTRVLETQEIGFALATAIFIDATLIRVILVPAAMRLMGHWNWWFPRALDRVVPRINLAEGADVHEAPAESAEQIEVAST
ncbi:MAG TPA: MMPL family transporter [Ktedonobacterales bacterium]